MVHKIKMLAVYHLLAFALITSVSTSSASQINDAAPPAEPEFSRNAGTFTEPSFELRLTAEEGATIYYTINGDLPDSSSARYSEDDPILISGTKKIRARAYRQTDDGSKLPGPSATKIYSRLDPDIADFDSDLPLVIVSQTNKTMLDNCDGMDNVWEAECKRTNVHFTVIEQEEDGRARLLSDSVHLQSRTESNYRGSSSLQFPKKQFGVRLIDENDENRNEPILGMPSENNWIMHAPYDDKTLMRNAVAYRLSRDMGRYAPRTRFVELFLHDGDGPVTSSHYHGVYMLVERIKWDNNRVNITKIGPDDNQEPEITGGYIINYDRDTHFRSDERNTGFALVRPQDRDITPEQRSWISGYIGDLERALFGPDFDDPQQGYAAWMDPESFIDHHLITETLKEIDGFRLSTYLHKDRGGRLVMGPVWDYNISLGNGDYLDAYNPQGWYHDHPDISGGAYMNGWYTRLFEDPGFEDRYEKRWWELREGPFATDHIVGLIRDYADLLDEAQHRNFERWQILGDHIWPNYFVGQTYDEEVEYMVDWIEQRLSWIDSQMGTPPKGAQSQLRYFWYFGDEMANNTPLEKLEPQYALIDSARIRFKSALEGYPFEEEHPNWRKASMERRNRPTDINYQPGGNYGRPFDHNRMRALQVRQPFTGDGGENIIVFEVPTTGLEDVLFRFAAMDEAAADELIIEYSVDENETWTTDGLEDSRQPLTFEYQKYEIDFSDIDGAADNPDFRIRIRFDGDDMTADKGNRVTFNNFSLGTAASEPTASDDNDHAGQTPPDDFRLGQNYPNPFNPVTTIPFALSDHAHVHITVYDVTGRQVTTLTDQGYESGTHQITFDSEQLASGIYLVRATMLPENGEAHHFTQKITLIK